MTKHRSKKQFFTKSWRIGVEYRRIAGLNPSQANLRRHPKWQIKQIARSIQTFHFNLPVLLIGCDIVAGHARVAACKDLGITHIPTIQLDRLSKEQIKAYMTADDRLTNTSEWHDHVLAIARRDLAAVDLNFDFDVIGFDMRQLDKWLEFMAEAASADKRGKSSVLLRW